MAYCIREKQLSKRTVEEAVKGNDAFTIKQTTELEYSLEVNADLL